MLIKPIRTEEDHDRALARIDELWGAPAGTPEGDEREILGILSVAYEEAHHRIYPPDPIDAIDARLEQLGLTRDELVPLMGGMDEVDAIMSRRKEMSLPVIRRLHDQLDLPADLLIRRAPLARAPQSAHSEGMSISS